MNFDTYKHFDPYSLRDLFNNNSDLVLEYYHYENEAIQCQELLDCSINTKKELINISKDIFKLISIIRSFTDINKNDYYDKQQLIINCRWILYNILIVSYSKIKKNNYR